MFVFAFVYRCVTNNLVFVFYSKVVEQFKLLAVKTRNSIYR